MKAYRRMFVRSRCIVNILNCGGNGNILRQSRPSLACSYMRAFLLLTQAMRFQDIKKSPSSTENGQILE